MSANLVNAEVTKNVIHEIFTKEYYDKLEITLIPQQIFLYFVETHHELWNYGNVEGHFDNPAQFPSTLINGNMN